MSPDTAGEGVEGGPGQRAVAIAAFEGEDPRLTPEEKETTIRFSRRDDRLAVFTAERGIGRRLLAHPEASIGALIVIDGDRARPGIGLDELDPEDPRPVVGVRAELPIGTLTVSREPRARDGHAAVITKRVLEEVAR